MAGICLYSQNINKYAQKRVQKNNLKILRRSGNFSSHQYILMQSLGTKMNYCKKVSVRGEQFTFTMISMAEFLGENVLSRCYRCLVENQKLDTLAKVCISIARWTVLNLGPAWPADVYAAKT